MAVESVIGSDVLLDESGWGWELLQTLNGSILAHGQFGIDTFLTSSGAKVVTSNI